MMFIVAHTHKQEAFFAGTILLIASVLGVLFFANASFRFTVLDAYNSVFKFVITDRVLRDDATVYSNLAYCNTDNPRQTLDLYVPKNAQQSKTKLVIFIHGGGWKAGDKSNQEVTYYGENFLKNNIAIASLNYRLFPEVTYPEPNDDISCAIKYLSAHVGEYGIINDKWTIFGDSAGAQLGAYAMSDPAVNQSLQLFVGFYGPYDLPRQINRVGKGDGDAWNYTNKGRDARIASPIYREPRKGATYMLFHGRNDRVVSLYQSESFAKNLTSD
ncbi:MAG: alpha/beta hydrolase, partial [Candidatus Saccharimonadales bacterium]